MTSHAATQFVGVDVYRARVHRTIGFFRIKIVNFFQRLSQPYV